MTVKPRRRADHITCKHCGREFRAISVFHLRARHGYDGDHPVNDYKQKFRLPFAMCAAVRKKISASKEDFWSQRGQHWTPATVIAAIRRIHRAGRGLGRRSVPVRLYEAGRRLFGTWEAALEKAELNYEEATGAQRWNPEKIVAAIQELARSGVPLAAQYVAEHHSTLFNAAIKQFPHSWAKALAAAGFDPDEQKTPRGRWDRQQAADWVRNRAAKGKSLLARAAPRDLLGFIHRRLGVTWPDFLESLGVAYPGIRKRRDWSKVKLLEEIRRWGAEGHRLNYKAVALEYQALIHQARKFFGSWDRARAAARV